jgi:hypothetical protein
MLSLEGALTISRRSLPIASRSVIAASVLLVMSQHFAMRALCGRVHDSIAHFYSPKLFADTDSPPGQLSERSKKAEEAVAP